MNSVKVARLNIGIVKNRFPQVPPVKLYVMEPQSLNRDFAQFIFDTESIETETNP